MSSLFTELGIDWKLLLAQGVNFFIILAVLTIFVYRPLLKLVEERRKKIQTGLEGAAEIEKRLAAIEIEREDKLNETNARSLELIKEAENKGRKHESVILKEAENKAATILKQAEDASLRKALEEKQKLFEEAKAIIKMGIIKTVELAPEKIDEALIQKAASSLKERV